MPITNRMAELHDEISGWRQHLHANPELNYDVHETAQFVAEKLESFGCDEVVTGIGQTGVVAIINGASSTSNKVIGLRADMDALPILEATDKPYKSKNEGKMHACGHDGHTAMLLGAAKYLAETRNFDGQVALIFQPAEEGGAGGKAMVDDGMMERFNIQEVYGMHSMPGLEIGEFATCPGAIMAATDEFQIELKGLGGHAAMPQDSNDPIVLASQIVMAFQTIPSRNISPFDPLVISVTTINAGTTHNIIPETITMTGTVRSLSKTSKDIALKRMRQIIDGVCAANNAEGTIEFFEGYPATINHDHETQTAIEVAQMVSGKDRVYGDYEPTMGGEDFAYMLEERPGAYIYLGNGNSAGLHHPQYDFNDEAILSGSSFWIQMIESQMPQKKHS